MIKHILDLLQFVKGETEAIKIAQGKYKMPETIKEMFKQLKNK
tara:strand:+ start:137 stop:265 length:129 start_codon:yes stop_codon:yes gene_type:complete